MKNPLTLNELMQKHPEIKLDPEDKRKFGFWSSYISGGYIKTYYMQKQNWLHIHIAQPPEGYTVDHIDGNKLNNTKDNLRIATTHQQMYNRKVSRTTNSGYKGVSFEQAKQKFVARISIKPGSLKAVQVVIGAYDTAIEAAKAYDQWAKLYHKEFAVLNFPEVTVKETNAGEVS